MAYLGQSPFGQTVRTTTSVVATAGQTTVYPTGGYTIGYIDVWVNGVKLTENADFTANDSLSVVFDPALIVDDQIEIIAYGVFSFVDGVRRSGDTLAGTYHTQDLIPSANNTYDLGSATKRFSDVFSTTINTTGNVSADTVSVTNITQTQTNLQVDPAGTAFLNALIYG